MASDKGRVETHRLMLSTHDARMPFSQFADVLVGLRDFSFYIFFSRIVELMMRAVETVTSLLPMSRVTSTASIPIS